MAACQPAGYDVSQSFDFPCGLILKLPLTLSLAFLALSACLYAGLPFWLESPSRSNIHDPKNPGHLTATPFGTPTITPTFSVSPTISPTFTASPTYSASPSFSPTNSQTFTKTPTPGTGIQVYVKEWNGTPVPNSWVMLGNNAAGSQLTNAGGLASFPSAALPVDVHAFSPRSGGSPLLWPRVVSYTGANNPTITLDVFTNSSTLFSSTHTIHYQITATGVAGGSWNSDEISYSPNGTWYHSYSSGSSVTNDYDAQCTSNSRHYFCGIEMDSLLNVVSSVFIPPFSSVSSDMTVTASTLTTNPVQSVTWNPSNVAFWPTLEYQLDLHPSAGSSDCYQESVPGNHPSGSPYTQALAYPSGIAKFRYRASSYVSGTPFHNASRYVDSAVMLSNVAMNMPGQVNWVTTPSNASTACSFQLVSGTPADFYYEFFNSTGDDGQASVWILLGPAGPGPTLYSMNLPSVFPAAIPSNYVFQTGLTFTASANLLYKGTAFDYSSMLNFFTNSYQWQSEESGNTYVW